MSDAGVLAWLAAGLPLMLAVSWLAGRLLGSRRGVVRTLGAGIVGFTLAVLIVLQMSAFDLADSGLVRDVFALGLFITMLVNIVLDLLTRPKTMRDITRANRAGIPTTTGVPHPIRKVREAIEPVSRYRQVVTIARRNGLGPLIGRRARAEAEERPIGERVRNTLEECGGMFVKLGQVASTRSDLLPPEITEELRKLQADAPPAPAEAVRELLEAELDGPVESVFADFDWQPLAAASIAQAHRATLKDGTAVVVKIQRPAIEALVRRDTKALMQVAHTVAEHTAFGARYDIAGMAGEFVSSLELELDFQVEGRNGLAIAANVANNPEAASLIVVPKVYAEFSTRKVLVQELLDGSVLGDGSSLEAAGTDRHHMASTLLDAFLGQMLFDGIYHADPHPGNIIVLSGDRLGLIDFGAVGLVDQITREALQEMVLAVLNRDPHRLRQAVASVTTISPNTDDVALERALSRYMTEHVQAGAGIDARALNDLAPLFADFGIALPTQLTTFGRTLVTLEGTLHTICDDFSLADGIQKLASRWMADVVETDPEELLTTELINAAPVLRRLPNRLDDLTSQLTSGQFVARTRMLSDERDIAVVSRLVNRIVLSIISLVVAFTSVALIITDAGPAFSGEATLLNVFGYVGLAGASVLALRITGQIVREGLD